MAVAVQGLGFLESGITDPLNHFSNTLLEFSAIMRHTVSGGGAARSFADVMMRL